MAKFFQLLVMGFIFMSASTNAADLDFSHVTSLEIAIELAEKGELEKVLLFPAEFGGEDVPPNVVYVPVGISDIKDELTGTIIRFYQDGLIDQLNVGPTYKGDSFVPATIEIKAWHSKKDGGFNPSIEIW